MNDSYKCKTSCVTNLNRFNVGSLTPICLTSCPTGYSSVGGICQSTKKCRADQYVGKDGNCASKCPEGKFVLEGMGCFDYCPTSHPFVQDYTVSGTTFKRCVSSCYSKLYSRVKFDNIC